jgi:hypothetical protein
MADLMLAGALAFLQLALGGMGIYLALRPASPRWHRVWILAFSVVGLAGVVLTVLIAYRADVAQDRLNDQIAHIQIDEAGTKGELSGIENIMGNVAKTGIPGLREFADSIVKAIGSSSKQQQVQGVKLTDRQLCDRTTKLAEQIRTFETDFESSSRDQDIKNFQMPMTGKTPEEVYSIRKGIAEQEARSYQVHDAQFQNQFLSDAKYDADRIIDRLPAEKRDELVKHNGQAEASLSLARGVGANDELMIAAYLDALAKTLCSK